jgi:hypothetical protein
MRSVQWHRSGSSSVWRLFECETHLGTPKQLPPG